MAKSQQAKVASEEVKPGSSPEVSDENTRGAVNPEESAPIEKPAKKPVKPKQTSFTVYKDGNPVRTYSVEQHGENAEELAEEFCAHSGTEVR